MPEPEKKEQKRRMWEVDPSMYQPGPKESKQTRYLLNPAKTLAKFGFYGLLLAYPLAVVYLGLLYGGLVFWGFLGGSVALIGLVLWKAGYAKNYEAWDPSLRRQLIGITVAFILALGFFLGITTVQWLLPVMFGLLAVAVVAVMRSGSL